MRTLITEVMLDLVKMDSWEVIPVPLLFSDWSLPFHKGHIPAVPKGQVCPLRRLGVSDYRGLPPTVLR